MVTKPLDAIQPMSVDDLFATMNERFESETFIVPKYDKAVEISILSSVETEFIVRLTRNPDNTYNNPLWNRLTVAYGMTAPDLEPNERDPHRRAEKVAKKLERMAGDMIGSIADRIWEKTNEYRDQRAVEEGADEPRFFRKRNGSSTGSFDRLHLAPGIIEEWGQPRLDRLFDWFTMYGASDGEGHPTGALTRIATRRVDATPDYIAWETIRARGRLPTDDPQPGQIEDLDQPDGGGGVPVPAVEPAPQADALYAFLAPPTPLEG